MLRGQRATMHGTREGTIVDADHHRGPSVTLKNDAQQRDPEMHQVKKRPNQWYFMDEGAHWGGRGHGRWCTAWRRRRAIVSADVHQQVPQLRPRPARRGVWGDAGYQGVAQRIRSYRADRAMDWQIALRCRVRTDGSLPCLGAALWPTALWSGVFSGLKSVQRARVHEHQLSVREAVHFGYATVAPLYGAWRRTGTGSAALFGLANLIARGARRARF